MVRYVAEMGGSCKKEATQRESSPLFALHTTSFISSLALLVFLLLVHLVVPGYIKVVWPVITEYSQGKERGDTTSYLQGVIHYKYLLIVIHNNPFPHNVKCFRIVMRFIFLVLLLKLYSDHLLIYVLWRRS